jgi:hypothetical protein
VHSFGADVSADAASVHHDEIVTGDIRQIIEEGHSKERRAAESETRGHVTVGHLLGDLEDELAATARYGAFGLAPGDGGTAAGHLPKSCRNTARTLHTRHAARMHNRDYSAMKAHGSVLSIENIKFWVQKATITPRATP